MIKIKALYGDKISKEELLKDIEGCKSVGGIFVGRNYFVQKAFLVTKYVALKDVVRIYLRIDSGEYGDIQLDICSIVVVFTDGSETEISIERRQVADMLFEALREKQPHIIIGKG